ncbi:hypothetical protein AKJ51_03650 [candidate division MSBL1 archaeon SCGC-AAA382A20]|uniref:Pyrrolysine biosynthesis protein PylD N-terminal domain-containing protein n=1 Tax=candidate division MSBL1 archaeon SCGC-AAA382A20 TaxID=1698280 RepID=A0A133VJ69_9EURY|nr:hypothetical protein AKJ51_03650 [candidate division MSBL1 archaeon SCGC-AAA382A20]
MSISLKLSIFPWIKSVLVFLKVKKDSLHICLRMTRLDSETLVWVRNNINTLDTKLKNLIDLGLEEICNGEDYFGKGADKENKIGVIPISSSDGVIRHFSETVSFILNYLDFNSEVASEKDVFGLKKSIEGNKDIVFIADDNRFVAIKFDGLMVIDNTHATARAYSILTREVLSKSSRSRCLLVGLGRVGGNILKYLFSNPLSVQCLVDKFYIYDINRKRMRNLSKKYPVKILTEDDLKQGIKQDVIIDATPSRESVCTNERILHKKTVFLQPGVPPSEKVNGINDYFHDPLALGVGTMGFMASQ